MILGSLRSPFRRPQLAISRSGADFGPTCRALRHSFRLNEIVLPHGGAAFPLDFACVEHGFYHMGRFD